MFSLHLVFVLRLCSADITTECWDTHGPLPSQDVIVRYATREECQAATRDWIDLYFAGRPFARPQGVPASYDLLMAPAPNFECQPDGPAIS